MTTLKDMVFNEASSSKGKKAASGSEGKTNFLSDATMATWLNRARRMANRNLTKEEWQKYLGDVPYRKTCPDLPGPEEDKQAASMTGSAP